MDEKQDGDQLKVLRLRKVTKWVIVSALILAVLVAILLLLRGDEDTWIKDKYGSWIRHGNPSSVQPEVAGEQTFTNTKYRFTFQFPSEWQNEAFADKKEDDGTGYPDYIFTTKESDPEKVQKLGILLPEKYYPDSTIYTGTTFDEWSAVNAGNCSADAPCAHASCSQISQKTPFVTANGLSGIKYYVIYKVESCIGGPEKDENGKACACQKVEREVGPIYILDTLAKSNNTLRLIRVAPEITANPLPPVSDDVWEKLVNSIKFY